MEEVILESIPVRLEVIQCLHDILLGDFTKFVSDSKEVTYAEAILVCHNFHKSIVNQLIEHSPQASEDIRTSAVYNLAMSLDIPIVRLNIDQSN